MVMTPIVEIKLETTVEMSPTIMENGNSVKLPEDKMVICASNCEDNTFDEAVVAPEEKQIMACANNCEDSTFHMEVSSDVCNHTMPSKGSNEDVEVDVVNDVQLDEERVADSISLDMTESSSSFESTDSEIGSGAMLGDMEVESQVREEASVHRFDKFSDLFRTRKKKLTVSWRNFVRPLRWRSKWVELHLRELRLQLSKYERKIAEYDRKKQYELEKQATEELGMKSSPFDRSWSIKLMKRRKRRRVEETVDLASYTSRHSLLSYYASKKPAGGSVFIDDDHGNTDVNRGKKTPIGTDEFGLIGGWTSFKDSDTFESILRKIDQGHLQVRQLRIRVDEVVKEHSGKFTSNGSSLAPNDPSASWAQNSVLPRIDAEKAPLASIYTTSKYPRAMKTAMPDKALSSHGGVTPRPETVVSTNQPQIDEKCKKMRNDILTYQQPMKEELNNTEAGIQCTKSPSTTRGKAENYQNVADPSSANQMQVTREQPAVKTRSISKLITPKNKRKRGRRKARSSRWARKLPG